MRIQFQELRRFEFTGGTTQVVMDKLEIELAQHPQGFLHIIGVRPAPDFDHRKTYNRTVPSMRIWVCPPMRTEPSSAGVITTRP